MAQRLTGSFLRGIVSSTCRKRNVSFSNYYCVSRSFSTRLLAKNTSSLGVYSRPVSAYFSAKAGAADVKLSEFLKEEIEAEKQLATKSLSGKTPTIQGFDVKTEEGEVILSKSHNNEKITVKFNVTESVDEDAIDEFSEDDPERQQPPQMFAKPPFQVEVQKNNQRLLFECEFVGPYDHSHGEHEEAAPPEDQDQFTISMVYMSEGEITEKVYGASGSILDGNLYRHLMNYLDERGINNKFAEELIQFSTHYEHSQYVNLLQKLRSFLSSK